MYTILIVEDDETISHAYKKSLEHEGFTVHAAISGPDALNLIDKIPVHLILLDIMLPEGMNGFDILMRLKQQESTKSIPVIVTTNLDSEKQTALDYGAVDYIVKSSIDVKQLVDTIKHHLPAS